MGYYLCCYKVIISHNEIIDNGWNIVLCNKGSSNSINTPCVCHHLIQSLVCGNWAFTPCNHEEAWTGIGHNSWSKLESDSGQQRQNKNPLDQEGVCFRDVYLEEDVLQETLLAPLWSCFDISFLYNVRQLKPGHCLLASQTTKLGDELSSGRSSPSHSENAFKPLFLLWILKNTCQGHLTLWVPSRSGHQLWKFTWCIFLPTKPGKPSLEPEREMSKADNLHKILFLLSSQPYLWCCQLTSWSHHLSWPEPSCWCEQPSKEQGCSILSATSGQNGNLTLFSCSTSPAELSKYFLEVLLYPLEVFTVLIFLCEMYFQSHFLVWPITDTRFDKCFSCLSRYLL